MRLRWAIFTLALAWSIAGGRICSAGSDAIDPRVGIPVFLKIITYDENFTQSQVKSIRLLIVYEKSTAPSFEQYLSVEEFLGANGRLLVGGREVEHQPVLLSDLDSILDRLSPAEYNVVLVTSIGKSKIRSLVGKIQEHGVRSFAFDPDYVSIGVAISVKSEPRQPAIAVNLNSARKEGSRFSAHLLKMCEVFKN